MHGMTTEIWKQVERRWAAAQRREMLRNQKCGAKTRIGSPCQMKPVPGARRCRLHGGLSTGPTTVAGRDRIAKAQRWRWARWRAMRAKGEAV